MLQQKSKILVRGQIKSSKEFKKFFLLQFTKELIRHSGEGEVFELKNILKEESDEKKEEIKKEKKKIQQIIKEKKEFYLNPKEKLSFKERLFKPLPRPPITRPRILRIPEPKLPPNDDDGDGDVKKKAEEAIPGYNLFILIGVISILSIIMAKKNKRIKV